ncbi:MAG: beta-galactosidase [Chloroflexi bacterium 54-19]|nr:MAG: beta-galactosidase [Chloroflexi bacterium 54-19]
MAKPIEAGNHQFRIDGKVAEVYGGAVHYWRLEREKWGKILDEVAAMGFTTISIYIPWEVHEIERGKFDFSGNKDIDAFLTMIEERDMNIVVRPGPQINSELTWFGYPLRILADPEIQALNAQGTKAVLTQVPRPIPAVSYAADKFFDETALWYDAICEILARHAYPKGRLVAAQVDNEMAFFFHVNAYACDFHPSAIRNFQAFLKKKYGSIETLNETYRQNYPSFSEIDAPRQFRATKKEEIPYYTDWVEYREVYLVNCIDRLAKMLRERGLQDIALFHNYPHPLGPGGAVSGFTTPFNLMGLEEVVDFVGFDIYSRKELYNHVKTVASYVTGTSRFPYIPEFIAGVWPWYLNPGELYDEEFVTKAALMHGIKGFSRYMLVERDRWLDSPIRRDGRVRQDHAAMFGSANRVLKETGWSEVRRQADVLLLANRDYDRLAAASVLVSFPGDFLETPTTFSEYPTFMTVSEKTLGFQEPVQLVRSDWFEEAYNGLTATGYAFIISDTALAPDRWQQYKVIVLNSYEYLRGSLQRDLLEFARSGGTVVLGPRLPELDERMQPDNTLASALKELNGEQAASGATIYRLGQGQVVHLGSQAKMAEVLEGALQGLELARFTRNDARLDVAIHRPVDGSGRRLVFVANPTADQIEAEITLDFDLKGVREVWEGRKARVDGRTLRETLPAYTIRIYACEA